MKITITIACLSMAATTLATPAFSLDARGTCTTPNGSGTCIKTSSCTSQGFNMAGHCPGATNIQCCVKKTCSTSKGSGICVNTSDGCGGGSLVSGHCPGDSSIQVSFPAVIFPATNSSPSAVSKVHHHRLLHLEVARGRPSYPLLSLRRASRTSSGGVVPKDQVKAAMTAPD